MATSTAKFKRLEMRMASVFTHWAWMITLAVCSAHAQSYNVLYSFNGTPDAANAYASLIHDAAGNLYGTSYGGGAHGQGAVFQVNTSGIETLLYSFTGGSDGGHPLAPLLRDQSGNFYGTASTGGSGACSGGCGVVFKIDATGSETVLYSFQGNADGFTPESGLIRDSAGNFYGTTAGGGSFGVGTVFKLDSAGKETVLLNFTGSNGSGPSGLLRDTAGNLYGTTLSGGGGACTGGCGLVYKLDASGNQTILYNFNGGSDGAVPTATLVRDSAGNLYSTTLEGGTTGYGTVFRLDPSGVLTTLYSFRGLIDGGNPNAGVIRDQTGNLYGTTWLGGKGTCNSGCGVVFKIDPSGHETVLHSFMGSTRDGMLPDAGLVSGPGGTLYGTT